MGGEIQLSIHIEQLRREGLEFAVSPPRVLTKTAPKAGGAPGETVTLEPFEELSVEVDEDHTILVLDKLSKRYATLQALRGGPRHGGTARRALPPQGAPPRAGPPRFPPRL